MATSAEPAPSPEYLNQAAFWVEQTLQVFACFFSILVYDTVVSLPREYRLIWRAPSSPIKWLYLLNRYWSFIAMLITLVMYNVEVSLDRCESYVKVEPLLPIGTVLSYQAILVARAMAMYDNSVWVLTGFGSLMAAEAGYLIWVVTECYALPFPTETGPCIVDGPHEVITAYFMVPMGVDTLLTLVTFTRVFVMKKTNPHSAVLDIFAREGILFFFCVFALNLTNGALYAQGNPFIRTIFAASAFILSSILACHLVLSLRSQTDPAHVNRDVYPLSDSVGSTRVFNVSNIRGRSVNSSRAVIGLPDLEKGVESEEGHIPEACEHPTPNGTSEVHVNPHKNLSRNYI